MNWNKKPASAQEELVGEVSYPRPRKIFIRAHEGWEYWIDRERKGEVIIHTIERPPKASRFLWVLDLTELSAETTQLKDSNEPNGEDSHDSTGSVRALPDTAGGNVEPHKSGRVYVAEDGGDEGGLRFGDDKLFSDRVNVQKAQECCGERDKNSEGKM